MVNFTFESATEQVAELIRHYPDLCVAESSPKTIRLRGKIYIYRAAKGYTLERSYGVEIKIPLNSPELPAVIDIEGAIGYLFLHRYKDGNLCLETDTTIKLRFVNGFNLVEWMKEFVEPFYFSYEYYCRYGVLPFGERPHGIEGVFDTYRDIFGETEIAATWGLMQYCAKGKYRGHSVCPCGSGDRLRNCHGAYLFPLIANPAKKQIVIDDVKLIKEVLKI